MRQNVTTGAKYSYLSGPRERLISLLPGVCLCGFMTLVAIALQTLELRVIGHVYIEALVIGILLGVAVRSVWMPPKRWQVGIGFSAKQLLEVAVMLLGASVSFAAIIASGWLLFGGIVITVLLSLGVSFSLSRALGLAPKMSILIACGNSICGNSAIAAVAPVIGATSDDVASSISFTAILGVIMVLALPLLIPLLQLSATQYGIVAGLTVYAVPQVLAATVPAGLVSTQVGTLVKLTRVLMLGPLVVGLSLVAPRWLSEPQMKKQGRRSGAAFRLVPWFIIGFLVFATLRSFGVIPVLFIEPVKSITTFLTIVSMVALGLGVDLKVVAKVGGRVTAAVTLSLLLLLAISLGIVHFLIT